MKHKGWLFVLIAFIIVIACSCSRKSAPERIVLPQTSFLSVQKNWGVVTSNYLRLREKPSQDSSALSGLTKSSIVEILSSTDRKETIDEVTSFWFRVNMDGLQGWVFGAYLDVFPNKEDAEARSRELK